MKRRNAAALHRLIRSRRDRPQPPRVLDVRIGYIIYHHLVLRCLLRELPPKAFIGHSRGAAGERIECTHLLPGYRGSRALGMIVYRDPDQTFASRRAAVRALALELLA